MARKKTPRDPLPNIADANIEDKISKDDIEILEPLDDLDISDDVINKDVEDIEIKAKARALVGGLHNPGATPRDDGQLVLRQFAPQRFGKFVAGIGRLDPGRSEHRHRQTDFREGLEGFDELRHDAEQPPRVLLGGAFERELPVIREGGTLHGNSMAATVSRNSAAALRCRDRCRRFA